MLIKKIFRNILFCSTFLLATWQATAQSKMPQVLLETSLPQNCKDILLSFSEELIGPKKHRILSSPNPHAPFFEAFMLLSYNDQDSHVLLTAIPMGQNCEVSYSENFEIDIPCMEAREALFKRWRIIGKLSDTTMVVRYDHPRDKKTLPVKEEDRAMAYLTQTRRGEACLVTKRQQHIQNTRKDK